MENHHKIIERYQLLYEKNYRSKVFAPLAESYIKIGLLQSALDICEKGVVLHPHFPSGHMALAKTYLGIKQPDKALVALKKVIELSPENILAHKLLANTLLKQKEFKSALRSFKMVLFLNPKDAQAIEKIREIEKLTSITQDDTFEMSPLQKLKFDPPEDTQTSKTPDNPQKEKPKLPAFLERTLSLVDAYIGRNEVQYALKALEDAENSLGPHPELRQRIQFLTARPYSLPPDIREKSDSISIENLKKVTFLKKLLARIEKNVFLGSLNRNPTIPILLDKSHPGI